MTGGSGAAMGWCLEIVSSTSPFSRPATAAHGSANGTSTIDDPRGITASRVFRFRDTDIPTTSEHYLDYLDANRLDAPRVEIEIPGESGPPNGTMLDLTGQSDWFDFEAGCARLLGNVETHEAFFLADAACNWLAKAGEQPFFLRVDPWGPHPPYVVGKPFLDGSDADALALPDNFHAALANRPAHHAAYADYWEKTLGLSLEDWRRMAARALEHTMLGRGRTHTHPGCA